MIEQTLLKIENLTGLKLQVDEHFSGIYSHKGRKYFNVIVDEPLFESQVFSQLKRLDSFIYVEPCGYKRISIFPVCI